MKIDLSEKKIIVTGASSGIGFSIAEALIKTGATVAAHYNSNKKGAEKLLIGNSKVKLFQANLANSKETKRLMEAVETDFGKVDCVVLNAGIFEPHDTFGDSEDWLEVWQKTLNVNLTSVGILTQLACKHFKNQGEGTIVYISSRAAFRGETEEYLAYAASKGGVVSLARTVARSFGKYNIKAFNIAPGFTETEMAKDFIESRGRDKILDELSLNTLTQSNDIAPIVVLMVSGLMDHATGSTIDFNAGSYIH